MSFPLKICFLGTDKTVTVEVPVADARCGYGDRPDEKQAWRVAVYTETASLHDYEAPDGPTLWTVRNGAYFIVDPLKWTPAEHLLRDQLKVASDIATAAVTDACLADPEIAEAVARYEKVCRDIDRKYAIQQAQWTKDVKKIAKAFRRKTVTVGEQSVPGKSVVRSSTGAVLGYANVWNGRWLGSVEKLR